MSLYIVFQWTLLSKQGSWRCHDESIWAHVVFTLPIPGHPGNRMYTLTFALSSEEDWAMAKGNMHRKLGQVWIFWYSSLWRWNTRRPTCKYMYHFHRNWQTNLLWPVCEGDYTRCEIENWPVNSLSLIKVQSGGLCLTENWRESNGEPASWNSQWSWRKQECWSWYPWIPSGTYVTFTCTLHRPCVCNIIHHGTHRNASRPFLCCWRHLANTIEWSNTG